MTSQQDMIIPIPEPRSIPWIASPGGTLSSSRGETLAAGNQPRKASWFSAANGRDAPEWMYLGMPDAESRSFRWRKRKNTGDGDHVEETAASGQIVRDSREPAEKEPAAPVHDPGPPSSLPDLIAFVAVLTTGIALVIFGHVPSGGLTTACVALGGLYAVWLRFRRSPRK